MPPEHVWPLEQAVQAAPPDPHAGVVVPVLHVFPEQHPEQLDGPQEGLPTVKFLGFCEEPETGIAHHVSVPGA